MTVCFLVLSISCFVYLRFSHVSPVYPTSQSQEYPKGSFMHEPPFLQGFSAQKSFPETNHKLKLQTQKICTKVLNKIQLKLNHITLKLMVP